MTSEQRIEFNRISEQSHLVYLQHLRTEAKKHLSDGRQQPRRTPEERAAAEVYASGQRSLYCCVCRHTLSPGYPSTAQCFNAGHEVIS